MIYSLKYIRQKINSLRKKAYEKIFSIDLTDEELGELYCMYITLMKYSMIFFDVHEFNPYCGISLLDKKMKDYFDMNLLKMSIFIEEEYNFDGYDLFFDLIKIETNLDGGYLHFFEISKEATEKSKKIGKDVRKYCEEQRKNSVWIAFKILEKINKINPLERKKEEYKFNKIIFEQLESAYEENKTKHWCYYVHFCCRYNSHTDIIQGAHTKLHDKLPADELPPEYNDW